MEKSKRDEIKKRIKKCCNGKNMSIAIDNLLKEGLASSIPVAMNIYSYWKENQK